VIKFRHNIFKQEMKDYSLRSINSLILFGVRNACLSSGRSPSLYQFRGRAIKLTAVIITNQIKKIIGENHYQLNARFYPISFPKGYVLTYTELLGIINVGFDITNQLLITFFPFIRYCRRIESTLTIRRLHESLQLSQEESIIYHFAHLLMQCTFGS
jgi:hypothetical protein